MKSFKIEISEIEKGPKELELQLPIQAKALKLLPGKDRSDYVLVKLEHSVMWIDAAKDERNEIEYLVLCSKFKGQSVDSSMKEMTVALAFVLDNSIIKDKKLDLKKCKYAAVVKASALSKWNIFS
jgi:hypothetical protein